jgi:hypothetical protein
MHVSLLKLVYIQNKFLHVLANHVEIFRDVIHKFRYTGSIRLYYKIYQNNYIGVITTISTRSSKINKYKLLP